MHHTHLPATFLCCAFLSMAGRADSLDEALALVPPALRRRGGPGPYARQAAIAALHGQATTAAATDWPQIAALYGELVRLTPSPVIELNHAVALGMAQGAARGLQALEQPQLAAALAHYHLFHAARADLLRRAGQVAAARAAYTQALGLCQNRSEQSFLRRRLAELP